MPGFDPPDASARPAAAVLLDGGHGEATGQAAGLLDLQVGGQRIPSATLHIFSLRLDGDLLASVTNTGRLPALRAELERYRSWAYDGSSYRLLHDASRGLGVLRRGAGVQVRQGWSVQGALPVLWALITVLFTGLAKVQQDVELRALGYSRRYQATLVAPVDAVKVAWD